MLEKLYTIPINEAFEARDGCPFCALYKKLEENELSAILGASMMEPDVRKQTNQKGFCTDHFSKMYRAQKRLPLALMLESHLQSVTDALSPGALCRSKGEAVAREAQRVSDSCYVCDRIEFHFEKMFSNACLLYDADRDFREKLKAQPYFCLSHYARFLTCAARAMNRKRYGEFVEDIRSLQDGYLKALSERTSKFCQKFDYRRADEPWGDEKFAIEEALALFGAQTGEKKK